MKEYLDNRLKSLKEEYSQALKDGANSGSDIVSSERSLQWAKINDIKSRIDEIKLTSDFFKENNYTNS